MAESDFTPVKRRRRVTSRARTLNVRAHIKPKPRPYPRR